MIIYNQHNEKIASGKWAKNWFLRHLPELVEWGIGKDGVWSARFKAGVALFRRESDPTNAMLLRVKYAHLKK